MSVGTWTFDETTSCVMNSSRVGSPASSAGTARGGGVFGGVGGNLEFCGAAVGGGGIIVGSHWMTLHAAEARYEIILLDTGV